MAWKQNSGKLGDIARGMETGSEGPGGYSANLEAQK